MVMEEKKKILDISIIDVFKILKADFRKVCIYSCTAGVIGVILAFATPKIYKSTVILAPEESGSSFSGSLSSLASMVGMNMKIGQTGDALYPEIYPDLMESTGFIVGMFPVTVTKSKSGETYTYFDYLQKHQKLAFYEYPIDWLNSLKEKFSDDEQTKAGHKVDSKHLTKKEFDIVKAINGKMNCSVDKKTNVITIVVKDQDPQIAATIADSAQMHLQRTITDYRTKKARVDLEYMQQLFDEAHKEYSKARQKYAAFGDSYQNLKMQSYVLKGDELENEMQLKYTIYQQVVEQLQLAKAKVQERTPAFTIVQEATVPVKHSSRPKIVTLIIWMILGFLLRTGMLLWHNRQQFINV
ncbi:MAG: chain-length determining protein [Prevotella sp.]|nr:chain-length determining protein [Prevotella sp.]